MGLQKNKTEKPENTDDTSAPAEEVKKKEAKVTPETKEVAVKEQAAPPAVAEGEAPSLMDLQNVFPGDEFGTNLPRIVPASGAIKVAGTQTVFGKCIDIQVISVSDRWMITPVAPQTDKEAKKSCRASFDGEVIPDRDGGPSQNIQEYIDSVDKYEEFDTKKYMDIFAIIINTADKDFKEVGQALGLVQISVSPTAVGAYTAFARQTPLNVARGLIKKETQNCMRVTADPRSSDSNEWTVFTFHAVPHAELDGYVPVVM